MQLCDSVGQTYPIPVEVAPFLALQTMSRIAALPALVGCEARLRTAIDMPARNNAESPTATCDTQIIASTAPPAATDNGNFIVDIFLSGPLDDAAVVCEQLERTVGVAEHGIFVSKPGVSLAVIVCWSDGRITTTGGE